MNAALVALATAIIAQSPPRVVTVQVAFENSKQKSSFSGPVTAVFFGSEQYVWINDGPNSHPDPEASITVLRGKLGAP